MKDDLINREAALKALRHWQNSELIDRIEKLPSVGKIILGMWIHKNNDQLDWLECSECGYGSEGKVKFGQGTPFCPMCGADMRGMHEK